MENTFILPREQRTLSIGEGSTVEWLEVIGIEKVKLKSFLCA